MTASHEDETLWRHVTRDVRPLRGKGADAARVGDGGGAPRQERERGVVTNVDVAEVVAPAASQAASQTARLARSVERRLQRGTFPIDYRLDLHGFTVEEARRKIEDVLMVTAPASGFRLVHIITGKGARSGADEGWRLQGKLRHHVKVWLREPPLRGLVLAVRRAARHHGGDGALYVVLRKIPQNHL